MRRILVVPHSLQVELSESFLDRRSFRVRSALDAHEAIAAAETWHPQLIIFSSNLPGSTPAEFCRNLRADERLDETKLMMLTGDLSSEAAVAEPVEVDVHLIQPVDSIEFLRAVGALLDVETRRAPRLSVILLSRLDYERDGEAQTMMANILGISETGMLLETEHHLTIGSVITVRFVVPSSAMRLAVRGMVLAADELQLHYGCEFVALDPDAKAAIKEFVDSQLARRKRVRLAPAGE